MGKYSLGTVLIAFLLVGGAANPALVYGEVIDPSPQEEPEIVMGPWTWTPGVGYTFNASKLEGVPCYQYSTFCLYSIDAVNSGLSSLTSLANLFTYTLPSYVVSVAQSGLCPLLNGYYLCDSFFLKASPPPPPPPPSAPNNGQNTGGVSQPPSSPNNNNNNNNGGAGQPSGNAGGNGTGGGAGAGGGNNGGGNILPATLSIDAIPRMVQFGGSATIEWTTTNVDTCSVEGPNLVASLTSGSQVVDNITQQSEYTLTCLGLDGLEYRDSANIFVAPAWQEF
ncbi:hypothetical protein CL652_01735 [bacterium]|nr:hypothetical protein [bacterium]|tara:strand:- start:2 stop:841 length:840 start_codon:yes stop_codon:yes gene_type:complete